MATDLETGEVGNALDLIIRVLERRQKRWSDHIKNGLDNVKAWKAKNPQRRVTPTRFYKLVHAQ